MKLSSLHYSYLMPSTDCQLLMTARCASQENSHNNSSEEKLIRKKEGEKNVTKLAFQLHHTTVKTYKVNNQSKYGNLKKINTYGNKSVSDKHLQVNDKERDNVDTTSVYSFQHGMDNTSLINTNDRKWKVNEKDNYVPGKDNNKSFKAGEIYYTNTEYQEQNHMVSDGVSLDRENECTFGQNYSNLMALHISKTNDEQENFSHSANGITDSQDRESFCHELEKKYVHDVYDYTAHHFVNAKYKAWPRVKQFLKELEPGSLVADIGCGHGKYLDINNATYKIGSDHCDKLVNIASCNNHEVMVCDNLRLPYRSNCFDAVISIGVIHHFTTIERRLQAILELNRVLRPGGKLMIYVWALEQKRRKFRGQDVLVPWHLKQKEAKQNRRIPSASSLTDDENVFPNYTKNQQAVAFLQSDFIEKSNSDVSKINNELSSNSIIKEKDKRCSFDTLISEEHYSTRTDLNSTVLGNRVLETDSIPCQDMKETTRLNVTKDKSKSSNEESLSLGNVIRKKLASIFMPSKIKKNESNEFEEHTSETVGCLSCQPSPIPLFTGFAVREFPQSSQPVIDNNHTSLLSYESQDTTDNNSISKQCQGSCVQNHETVSCKSVLLSQDETNTTNVLKVNSSLTDSPCDKVYTTTMDLSNTDKDLSTCDNSVKESIALSHRNTTESSKQSKSNSVKGCEKESKKVIKSKGDISSPKLSLRRMLFYNKAENEWMQPVDFTVGGSVIDSDSEWFTTTSNAIHKIESEVSKSLLSYSSQPEKISDFPCALKRTPRLLQRNFSQSSSLSSFSSDNFSDSEVEETFVTNGCNSHHLGLSSKLNENNQCISKNSEMEKNFVDEKSQFTDTNTFSLDENSDTFKRYYHVFKENELDDLMEKHCKCLEITDSTYDHANWCVIARKK